MQGMKRIKGIVQEFIPFVCRSSRIRHPILQLAGSGFSADASND